MKPFYFGSIAIQRSGGLDDAVFKIHFEHQRSRETELHHLFEEYREDFFGTFGGEQAQRGQISRSFLDEQDRFL